MLTLKYTLRTAPLSVLLATTLFLYLSPASAQIEVNGDCSKVSAKEKLSIVEQHHSAGKPELLVLSVVIRPQDFNQECLTALACSLNRQYAKESAIDAKIFDDVRAAKSLRAFDTDQKNHADYLWHLKGHYQLDRVKNEEYVEFVFPEMQPTEWLFRLRTVKIWLSRH